MVLDKVYKLWYDLTDKVEINCIISVFGELDIGVETK